MKKVIALLAAAGLLVSMATPVFAEEQITTHKGEQEIVLTEAGDAGITYEELTGKIETTMKDTEEIAFIMDMELNANASFEAEGTSMSMDMNVTVDGVDNKTGGCEYNSMKMSMAMMGMQMTQDSEEYVFPNAGGKKVSVKKETESDGTEETGGEWVAEEADETDGTEDTGDMSSVNSVVSDDLFSSFELLDKKYTDGEKEYYVLKGDMKDVMNSEAFAEFKEIVGDLQTEEACYMLVNTDFVLESLYMDFGEMNGIVDEETGMEMSISKFLISMYSEEPFEITIPEEVQAAGDAVA